MKKLSRNIHKYLARYVMFLTGIMYACVGYCDSTDPLATAVKPEVMALFGPSSTVAYCIYLAEIVVGAAGYIKTKNLMLLVGLPILVLFTHTMFSYIGGQ